MRNDTQNKFLMFIHHGKVLVERGPGRSKISWFENMISKTTTELIRAAIRVIHYSSNITRLG
jgi:hypothetical protein